jgi:hypothetical protein
MADAFRRLMTPASGPIPGRPAKKSEGTKGSARKRSAPESILDGGDASKRVLTDSSAHSADRDEAGSPRRTSVAGFLNSLSSEEAVALDRVMRSALGGRISATSSLNDETRQLLLPLTGLEDGSTHDGSWWVDLCKCEIVGLKSDDHPRWQVDLNGTGRSCNVALVREILSAQSFSLFQAASTEGAKKVVKLPCHHVSYNADLSRRDTAPLPLDAGAGGSISHTCDKTGCVRVSHLEVTGEHKSNLYRQRCQGPSLLVFRGVIVQERPCAHGKGETREEQLLNSCVGSVQVHTLTDASAGAIVSLLATM